MLKQSITCGTCGGTGQHEQWEIVSNDGNTGTAKLVLSECSACGGKGYKEFALLTVEEAETILKHCGINQGTGDI